MPMTFFVQTFYHEFYHIGSEEPILNWSGKRFIERPGLIIQSLEYWTNVYLILYPSLGNLAIHIVHAHLILEFPPGLPKCMPFAVVRKKECFICIAFNSQVDAKMLAKKHKWFPLLPCCAD